MAVDGIQAWTFGPFTNEGELQTHYWRMPVAGLPHILATAYLNEVSIGQLNGTRGIASAAFKRFEFMDEKGLVQETELTDIVSAIDVQRCVSITIALDLRAATACGGWTFYYLS
jgi:hypothetical protein